MTTRNGWQALYEAAQIKPTGAKVVHPLAIDPVDRGGRPKSPIPAKARANARNEKVKAARRAKRKAEAVYKTSAGEALLIQQMGLAGITDWQREYRFSDTRMWRLDFAWPAVKLAVEIEGGTFSGGRHTRGVGFAKDCEKHSELTLAGWSLLRCTTEQVKSGQALQWVTDMLCGLGMVAQKAREGTQAGRGDCTLPNGRMCGGRQTLIEF